MNRLVSLFVVLFALIAALPASADTLAELEGELAEARAANAEAYAFVDHVRDKVPSLQMRARGRYAVIGPMLEAFGDGALDPMLQALIDDHTFEVANARRAWRVGLLHAVGRKYSERSRPVLEDIIQTEKDTEVIRAAAAALGKLLDEESADFLVRMSADDSDRARAALAGMGTCRRASVARHIAARLESSDSAQTRLVAILSLRDIANSWAWKTTRVSKSGERKQTAAVARDALVAAYFSNAEVRSEIVKAILIVNAEGTRAAIQKRSNDAPRLAAKLVERLKDNPLDR